MHHLSFYVPLTHAEEVKEALFRAGAGAIGAYRRCSFEVEGVGQFQPAAGSDPFIGKTDVLERVPELKVEMVCSDSLVSEVVAALKEAHPYEEPAYYVIKTLDF